MTQTNPSTLPLPAQVLQDLFTHELQALAQLAGDLATGVPVANTPVASAEGSEIRCNGRVIAPLNAPQPSGAALLLLLLAMRADYDVAAVHLHSRPLPVLSSARWRAGVRRLSEGPISVRGTLGAGLPITLISSGVAIVSGEHGTCLVDHDGAWSIPGGAGTLQATCGGLHALISAGLGQSEAARDLLVRLSVVQPQGRAPSARRLPVLILSSEGGTGSDVFVGHRHAVSGSAATGHTLALLRTLEQPFDLLEAELGQDARDAHPVLFQAVERLMGDIEMGYSADPEHIGAVWAAALRDLGNARPFTLPHGETVWEQHSGALKLKRTQ